MKRYHEVNNRSEKKRKTNPTEEILWEFFME